MVARTKPFKEKTTLSTSDYAVYCCADGHIHIDVLRGEDAPVQLTFEDGESAYDFAHAILRGYDIINGLAEPKGHDRPQDR